VGRSPPKCENAVSGTEPRPCATFQPTPFSSFGGNVSETDSQTDIINKQTNRQTDRQAANLVYSITMGDKKVETTAPNWTS